MNSRQPQSDHPQAVLIADDDPDIRHAWRDLLSSEGYTILEAADGGRRRMRCCCGPITLWSCWTCECPTCPAGTS
jgi:response regulator RpfG family c-di-GMP phosphodiesterase